MIAVQNISFSVGKKMLLENVSMQFDVGKINLILGPNGAGKSTLIKAICQQIKPQEGSISFGGKPVKEYAISELAKCRAVLSQNIDLAFPMLVKEVVMMGRYPHFTGLAGEKDVMACQEAMAFFDIDSMAERDYLNLSGGEKQRVHFARVLAQLWYSTENQTRYLLLDEPLTFLDIRYQYQFMHQLQSFLEQKNVVVVGVVHDLNLAAKFADHIVILHEGKVLAQGRPNEVITSENISKAYSIEPMIKTIDGIPHLFF